MKLISFLCTYVNNLSEHPFTIIDTYQVKTITQTKKKGKKKPPLECVLVGGV
jgi:hypothetical protein